MMRRWRRLLSLALVLWLPLHGGASLALGLCAAMQLQDAGAVAEPAAPCHGHDGAAAPVMVAPADAHDPAAHDGGACAHCAACQVQAAALPATPALTQPALPAAWTTVALHAPPQRTPELPERPPRVRLA